MLRFCLPPEHQPYRHRKLWGVQKPNRKWLGPSCPLPSSPSHRDWGVRGVARDLWTGGPSWGREREEMEGGTIQIPNGSWPQWVSP